MMNRQNGTEVFYAELGGPYKTVFPTGNVGVGMPSTSTPIATLQVSGSFTVSTSAQTTTPSLHVDTNGNVAIGYSTIPSFSIAIGPAALTINQQGVTNKVGLWMPSPGAGHTGIVIGKLALGTNNGTFHGIDSTNMGLGFSATGNAFNNTGRAFTFTHTPSTYSQTLMTLRGTTTAALERNILAIESSASTVMTAIDSYGRMMIGGASPTTELEVVGTVSATRFVGDGSGLTGITADATDRITSGTTRMVAVSNTGYVSLTQAGTNTGWFSPYTGLVTLGVSATGGVSGTTGYFAGNVGIGTTKPQHTLDVSGSLRVIGTHASMPMADFVTSATFNSTTVAYGLRVWVNDTTWAGTLMTLGKTLGGSGYRPAFEFNNDAPQGDWRRPDLRMHGRGSDPGGGSMGALTYLTSTATNFDDAVGRYTQVYRVQRDDNTKLTTANLFQWRNYTTPVMTMNAAGQLGIGTALPFSTLHVAGTGRITSWTTVAANVTPTAELDVYGTVSATRFVGDGSGLTNLAVSGDRIVSGTSNIIANQNGSLTFTTAGAERMTIGANGGVGIDTAAPSSTLHVAGTGRITSWTTIAANVTATTALEVFGTVSGTRIDGGIGVFRNGSHADNGNPGAAVRIGYNTADDYGFIQAIHPGVNWKGLALNPGNGNVLIGMPGGTRLSLYPHLIDSYNATYNNRLFLNFVSGGPVVTSGALGVGVGNGSLSNTISIAGTAHKSIGVERSPAPHAGFKLTVSAGGAAVGEADKNGGDLVLSSGLSTGAGSSGIELKTYPEGSSGSSDNSPRTAVRITGAGNVGIGTTSPNATLQVSGTARITSWTTIAANVTPTAELDVYGTVSATRFTGDGSGLTNLSVSGDRIVSGTTSIVANLSSSLVFSTAANQRMVLGANGQLTIEKPYYANGIRINHGSTTSGGQPALAIIQHDQSGWAGAYIMRGKTDGYGGIMFGTSATVPTASTPEWFSGIMPVPGAAAFDYGIAVIASGTSALSTGGATAYAERKLVIKPNGNIGIAMPHPQATLQVSGSFIVSTTGQTTTPSLYVGRYGKIGIGTVTNTPYWSQEPYALEVHGPSVSSIRQLLRISILADRGIRIIIITTCVSGALITRHRRRGRFIRVSTGHGWLQTSVPCVPLCRTKKLWCSPIPSGSESPARPPMQRWTSAASSAARASRSPASSPPPTSKATAAASPTCRAVPQATASPPAPPTSQLTRTAASRSQRRAASG
jgi:hypothetical protein